MKKMVDAWKYGIFLLIFLALSCHSGSAAASHAADYSAVFDAAYYASHYDDIMTSCGKDRDKLLAHFLAYGMREGRQANAAFNVDAYRARYADLRKAFGDDNRQYYLHYIHYGKQEGRNAKPGEEQEKQQVIYVNGKGGTAAELVFCEISEKGERKELLRTKAYIGKNGFSDHRTQGDKTTPTGDFPLTMAFGIAADPGCAMGYTQVDDNDYWCGDDASPYYNRFVSADHGEKFDRKRSEHLIDYTKSYQYCLNIGFNEEQTPGYGSAIFLHCYGNVPYTAGCVAIPGQDMITVLKQIRAGCRIVIRASEE